MNTFTAKLIADGDDFVIPLSDETFSELGWQLGDVIEFVVQEDGTIVISKKKTEKVYVMVEATSSFTNRYAYLVDADKLHLAINDVKYNDERDEFSQEYLGESITKWDILTKEQVLDAFDKQNDYAKGWSDGAKLDFVTKL